MGRAFAADSRRGAITIDCTFLLLMPGEPKSEARVGRGGAKGGVSGSHEQGQEVESTKYRTPYWYVLYVRSSIA